MTDDETTALRRAWGWAAHLQDGGSTPWAEWAGAAEPRGSYLPGAQQLELLRRLNATRPVSADLATRVLEASAPGRGQPDLPLSGGSVPRPYGPLPVDPAALPDDELARVASSVIADDVVAAGLPARARRPVPQLWRRRYRLEGDPILSGPRQADLLARGRRQPGRGSPVLVLGTDVGQMLVHTWTARSMDDGALPWSEWIARAARADNAPPRVDLVRTAAHWRARVGDRRVRVVLDVAAATGLVGERRPLDGGRELPADAVDLVRRVGLVVGLLVPHPDRVALLRAHLLPRLVDAPGEPLVLADRYARRAGAMAIRMRDGLIEGRYAVVGRPDSLLPAERPGVTEPSAAGVLSLALHLLLENK
jgi:hypothetical protein